MQWPGKGARSLCKRSEEERQWEQEIIMHLSMSSPRGSGNPRKFDRDAYPQGGDFDLTSWILSVNFKSVWEVNHLFLLILTFILCPGVGILIFFLENVCCVWFIYRKMELRYWLVPGNLKNNRMNELNEKRSLIPWGLRVPIWKIILFLEFCGFQCFLDVGRGCGLPYVA